MPKSTEMTSEEYIALEDARPYRSEFYDGAMLAMKGRMLSNVQINGNLLMLLHRRLDDTPFQYFSSSMRVVVPVIPLYTYPDATLVRRPACTAESSDTTLVDPCLVFEVLSPSDYPYERRANFQRFQEQPILLDYVQISQDRPLIEHFSRIGDTALGRWLYTSCKGLEAILRLPSVGVELALNDIYEKVDFPLPGTTLSHKHPDHDRIF